MSGKSILTHENKELIEKYMGLNGQRWMSSL